MAQESPATTSEGLQRGGFLASILNEEVSELSSSRDFRRAIN